MRILRGRVVPTNRPDGNCSIFEGIVRRSDSFVRFGRRSAGGMLSRVVS